MNYQKGWKYFVKKSLFILALLCQVAFAYPPLPEAGSESEALFVRRIIDFWRDKEYQFAKNQIHAYMNDYPGGRFTDHFYAMLGDIAMHEKAHRKALDYYNHISDEQVRIHTQSKRWNALYQLQLYTQLYQEIAPITLDESDEEGKFYFAEAAFREALTLLRFEEGKQQAKLLCNEALPIYKSLSSSAIFGTHASLAMAEIYRFLEKPQIAAKIYLKIAENQENPEEILFHAAAMLVQCDQEKAGCIFEKIARGSSSRAADAAYQWLQVLANSGQWGVIGYERDLWLAKIPNKHRAIPYFYLGMIAFDQGKHYQSIADLQNALDEGISPPHDRSALEALLSSSLEVDNLEICERSYALLSKRYPDRRPEAGYIRALAYRKAKQTQQARVFLDELIQQFPTQQIAQKASVEKVQILMENTDWDQAHGEVLEFLKLYPLSSRRGEMLRLAINLSNMRCAEGEMYEQLVEDLERAFAARIFQGEEYAEKRELLAKSYLKLDRVNAALGILHEMEKANPLLFTQCYIKEGNSPEKVVAFGERALELSPDQDRLHLHLFNAYLELAKSDPDEQLTKRAATHLDQVIDVYPVSLENRLWLAHYFVKTKNQRAIYLLESLLQTDTNWKRFDKEGVILARLYQKKGELKRALPLAKKIIALEQKTKPEGELILAQVYNELGEEEKAEALFAKLENSPHSPIAYGATLHLARLRFDKQPEKSLKKLRDLKVKKNLANEPIHLEAALDYAELQATLLPQDERVKSLLTALIEVKEEFTSEQDICSKDYHQSRQLMPEKEQIYQAYMRYLDAKIYYLQAKLAKSPQEKKAKQNAARALFSTLRQGKYAVSNYLVERARAGMYDQ